MKSSLCIAARLTTNSCAARQIMVSFTRLRDSKVHITSACGKLQFYIRTRYMIWLGALSFHGELYARQADNAVS